MRDASYRGALEAVDQRRTGMVWAKQGWADVELIASISGHELDHTRKILEVYLPRERAMARLAMARLDLENEPQPSR